MVGKYFLTSLKKKKKKKAEEKQLLSVPWGYNWLRPYLVCWRRFSKLWTDSGAILSSLRYLSGGHNFGLNFLWNSAQESEGRNGQRERRKTPTVFFAGKDGFYRASSEDFFQSCPLPPPIIQADFNLPEPPRLNPMQRTALDLQGQGRGGHKGPRAFSEEVQQGNASCWTGHVRRNRVCVDGGGKSPARPALCWAQAVVRFWPFGEQTQSCPAPPGLFTLPTDVWLTVTFPSFSVTPSPSWNMSLGSRWVRGV